MNSENSRKADYAQGLVVFKPSDQSAIVLQPHTDELSQSQGQAGQQADRVRPWRSHYEDNSSNENCPTEMLIDNEYELLKDAWVVFSEASQDKKSRAYTKKANPLEWRDDITIYDLRDSVRLAASKLDGSHGKARRYFDRFCSSLSSHSTILEVLPNQSQYLSIFCGTVKTLLNASDNYRKTMEGLSKALAEIGDYVHLAVQHAELINTSDMREAVCQLYAAVFLFLRESMLWYRATRLQRLGKSFDQNFYDKFSDLLDNIKQRAEKIHTRGNVGHHAKTTDIIHMTRHMNEKLDRILVSQGEDRKSYQQLQASHAQKTREGYIEIEDSSNTPIHGIITSPGIQTISVSKSPEKGPDLGENRSRPLSLRDEIHAASQCLDPHILDCIGPSDIVGSSPFYFQNNVVLAIRDWSIAPSSVLLRIGGMSEIKYPSATSAISASVVRTASDLNFPLIHQFCGRSAKQKEASIIRTLYSLIRQLIDQLHALDKESLSFSSARFQELDGTIKTWDRALSIFSELLLCAPPTLFVIIDGIERLESEQYHQEYISSLINVLGNQADRYNSCGRTSKRLKVLFTTAGPCLSLNKIDEKLLRTIVMRRQNIKRRPGEARLGRSQIILRREMEEG